jgi:hypothetical protein
MPSVSVPLKGAKGWDELMVRRRQFWRKPDNHILSPHFKAQEFYTHDGSACPITARGAMVRLCVRYLEPLRAKFGPCLVLSGYRHELYNRQIGGARHSQHIYEQSFESVAADVRFARGKPADWAREASRLRARAGGKGGIGRYDRSNFIHIDNRAYRADWKG